MTAEASRAVATKSPTVRQALFAAAFAVALVVRSATAAVADWLLVSDIHYNPLYHVASHPGTDTQHALLDSMFAALHAAEPAPPVVIITGDFLAHGFYGWDAAPTMRDLAQRFDAAFPRAQFVIALGNNDAACGDYQVTPDGEFLHAVAQAWAPLVNRRGAAPDFARTFSRDGTYAATLPIPGLRAVVTDDVFWSPRYRNRCGTGPAPSAALLHEVQSLLRAAPPKTRNWLVVHIPPGIDVYSTQLTRELFVLPFLSADGERRLESLAEDRADRVALVLAAHSHKFSYRLIGAHQAHPVPVLLAPSVSPIFYNAPSFLKLDVDAHGTIRNATEIAFDWKHWRAVGSLRSLELAKFTAPDLLELQKKMGRDPRLRETFSRLYDGGGRTEMTEDNWRLYWCGATALSAAPYSACARDTASGLAVRFFGLGLVALAAVATLAAFALRRRAKASGAGRFPAFHKKASRKPHGV